MSSEVTVEKLSASPTKLGISSKLGGGFRFQGLFQDDHRVDSEVKGCLALLLQYQIHSGLYVLHLVAWLHQVWIQDQVPMTMENRLCDSAALVAKQRGPRVIDACAHLRTVGEDLSIIS